MRPFAHHDEFAGRGFSVISNPKHSLWLTLGGLGLLVILGAYLRITGLNMSSIIQPEVWMPGIRMPKEIADSQALTVRKVLTEAFSSDTHPFRFYVLMWGWTKYWDQHLSSPSAGRGVRDRLHSIALKEMVEALAEYPVLERIEMPYCRAVLFAPRKL